jgi:hypothetical protein
MSPRESRYAKNQALYRSVNDRIATLTGNWWAGQRLLIICECANTGCAKQIDVSLADYERVRELPDWFLIKPGHVVPEVEQVIEQHEGYDIIKV